MPRPSVKVAPGDRFGRLVYVSDVDGAGRSGRYVRVQCDCGTVKDVYLGHVLGGKTRSCGCFVGEQHGESGRRSGSETTEYRIWMKMKERCHNPNHAYYRNYGGRGIAVCEKWRESFAAFLAEVGRRPSSKHSLDRIDNDRGYEPGNVRWATRREQALNSRRVHMVTVDDVTMSIVEWAEKTGTTQKKIAKRIRCGWTERDAVYGRRGIVPPVGKSRWQTRRADEATARAEKMLAEIRVPRENADHPDVTAHLADRASSIRRRVALMVGSST